MRQLWMLGLLMLLGGCPAPAPESSGPTPPSEPDQFTRFGELIRSEVGFYDEFKRLQGLVTAQASMAAASRSDNDLRYVLSSRSDGAHLGFSLLNSTSGEEWTLWAVVDPATDAQPMNITFDQATATGRKLEATDQEGKLMLTLNARWVNGRYLQVTRELMAGGYDRQDRAGQELTSWVLSGPALPYRCVPALHGPYGVLSEQTADGAWQANNYPQDCMAPLVAAYNRGHGFLLGVADEHPRKLDRDYEVGYRLATKDDNQQLKLSYRQYDPTQDVLSEPYLMTGLPVRDTIVLEPFKLSSASVDPTLVETETREVLRRMGVLVRAFHFQPRPPTQLPAGNSAVLSEWAADEAGLPDAVRMLSGMRNVNLLEGVLSDGALNYGGKLGLGAIELPGGAGLAPELTTRLSQLDPALLPFLAFCDGLTFGAGDAYATAQPGWLVRDAEGGYYRKTHTQAENYLIDIRQPEVAAWAVRKMQADLNANPTVAGYRFANVADLAVSGQPVELGQYAAAYPAVGYAVLLRSAEAVQAARPHALLAADAGLRLALPAFCNTYSNGDGVFGSSFGSPEVDPALPLMNRLSNLACWELFGVEPTANFGGHSLSAQVLGATGNLRGFTILKAMEEHAGFAVWADNLDLLAHAGGELMVLHSAPARNSYTGGAERPASMDELLAVLPADLSGEAVWLAFHGLGGAVSVSASNELRVVWPGGEWQGQLPPGLWTVDHPTADAVLPGDAVLVRKRPIQAPGSFTPDRT